MNALERDDRFGIGGMAEYARGYSWRPSERRELNEGATYRRDWQPQGDLFAVLGGIGAAIAERASEVLPSVPLSEALPYVAALWQHNAQGSEATFRELLATSRGIGSTERLSADDAHVATLLAGTPDDAWLATDDSLYRVDEAPTRVKRNADGTVRGRLSKFVVGSLDELGLVKMTSDECTMRATLLLRASGMHDCELIGTDNYSWEEVVTHVPERVDLGEFLTLNGEPVGSYVLAPYGSGDSIQGNASRRPAYPDTQVTYSLAPVRFPKVSDDADKQLLWWKDGKADKAQYPHDKDSVSFTRAPQCETLAGFGATGDGMRILKRYATRAAITRGGLSTVIGCGSWRHPKVKVNKATGKARGKRVTPLEVTPEQAQVIIGTVCATALEVKRESKTTLRVGSYRVTVHAVPTKRVFRVSVSHDGTTVQRSHRTTKGVLAMVARLS